MIEIIHQLRMASGSNAKKRVLEMYKHNDEWLEVLKAMYDTSINYYVSAPKDTTFVDDINVDDMLMDLTLLSDRHYTGNDARQYAMECSQTYGEIFRLILGGSLRAGVSVTTINAVYPGLIREFKVMLAKDTDVVRYPILASTKYDGVRVVARVHNDRAVLKTRQGKILRIRSLEDQLKTFPTGVYDGELVSGNGLQAGRTTITGQVNRCLKGNDTDMENYTYAIFDYLPIAAWDRRQCTWMYVQRLQQLHNCPPRPNILIADQVRMDNAEQVEESYQDHIERGYEGLILRSEEDTYQWTRSAKLIKKKATNEIGLICTGVEEGRGKYAGMIGSLTCVGTIGGRSLSVNVGSGLSDHDRGRPFDDYIGKQIEVLYNDVVRASGAQTSSLFLPRFKRLRGDLNV